SRSLPTRVPASRALDSDFAFSRGARVTRFTRQLGASLARTEPRSLRGRSCQVTRLSTASPRKSRPMVAAACVNSLWQAGWPDPGAMRCDDDLRWVRKRIDFAGFIVDHVEPCPCQAGYRQWPHAALPRQSRLPVTC